jgi:hypothetical protein
MLGTDAADECIEIVKASGCAAAAARASRPA